MLADPNIASVKVLTRFMCEADIIRVSATLASNSPSQRTVCLPSDMRTLSLSSAGSTGFGNVTKLNVFVVGPVTFEVVFASIALYYPPHELVAVLRPQAYIVPESVQLLVNSSSRVGQQLAAGEALALAGWFASPWGTFRWIPVTDTTAAWVFTTPFCHDNCGFTLNRLETIVDPEYHVRLSPLLFSRSICCADAGLRCLSQTASPFGFSPDSESSSIRLNRELAVKGVKLRNPSLSVKVVMLDAHPRPEYGAYPDGIHRISTAWPEVVPVDVAL
jgi:hypothetical protein